MNPKYEDIIGLNQSGAKELLRSPAHYKTWLDSKDDETPALKFGRLCHTALLEPAKFAQVVKVGPQVPTKANKEWKEFVSGLKVGEEAVTPMEFAKISDLVTQAELGLAALGADGNKWETEQAITKDYNGVVIKGRVDLITEVKGRKAVVDFKTTLDATPQSFSRDIHSYKYHLQAAWYLELTRAMDFYLLVVEKEPPYAFKVYRMDEQSIAEGKILMDRAVSIFSSCLKLDSWPSYDIEVTDISIPKYALTNKDNGN